MKKRIISIVLSIVMLVSLLPTAAFAAGTDTGKAIQLVDSGTAANIGGGQADSIYFGTYKQSSDGNSGYNVDPIKWRVLSNADGKLFLLSNQNLDVFEYHKEWEAVTWETSTMRSWLNGLANNKGNGDNAIDYTNDNFLDAAFSAEEQTAIADTTVVNDDNPDHQTEGGNNTTDKIFLLSIAEAKNTSYFANDRSRKATNTAYVAGGGEIGTNGMGSVGQTDYWWLRSPGRDDRCAAYVDLDLSGSVRSNGPRVDYANSAVRPAFNLNLESVLFTSAAIGGKADTSVDGSLTEVGTAGTVWKLTLLDTNRSFSVSEQSLTGAPDGTVSISYSGAETGNNEYVSVMLAQGDTILYYGRIAQSSASGTASITIPTGLADGTYTLKVFSEQYNGEERTDYASAFVSIPLTVVSDQTAPALSAGTADRTGEVGATVKFTSNEAGTYYYAVVDSGADAPTIDTTGTGTTCASGENTISLSGLSGAGAKAVYIAVKDAAGNVSQPLNISIPACSYSVTLNTNGGTVNSGDVTGYTFGVGAALPTDVTRAGYSFGGWYENTGLAGNAVMAIGTTESGNKTFHAKWELTVPTVSEAVGYNRIYDGESHTISVTVAAGTDITYSYQWYKDGKNDSNMVDAAVYASHSVKNVADSGTYYCLITAANGTETESTWSNAVTVSIAKRSVTLTSATAGKTYDSTALIDSSVTITGDGFVSGEGATWTVTGTQTSAGSAENTFTYMLNEGTDASNYNITATCGVLTVSKRTVTLTSADASKTYDGTALTNSTVTVGGDGFVSGEGATWTVTGAQTNAGTSSNTFTYTLNEGTKANNYDITKIEGTLTVSLLGDKVTVTITENSGTKEYNGSEQSVTGYTVSISNALYTVNDFTFSGNTTANGTDAGTYNMGLKAEDFTNTSRNFTNVEFVIVDGALTITPKEISIASAGITPVTYDPNGYTLAVSGVTFDGAVTGHEPTYTAAAEFTDSDKTPGNRSVRVNVTLTDSNYSLSSTTFETTVSVSAAVPTATAPTAKTGLVYDGNVRALIEAGTSEHGHWEYSLDSTTYSSAIPTGTDAKTYTVYCRFVPNEGYDGIELLTLSVTIAPMGVDEPTAVGTYTYTGSEQTVTLDGVLGCMTVRGNKATHAGDYEVIITLDGNHKWNAESNGRIAWSIGAKTVAPTATLEYESIIYSGSERKPAVTLKDGDTEIPSGEYTVSYSNNVNVGTATVTITDKENGNYTFAEITKTFEITKDGVSPVLSMADYVYGGTPTVPSVSGNNGSGTVTVYYSTDSSKVDKLWEDISGTTLNVGTYYMKAHVAATDNYAEGVSPIITFKVTPSQYAAPSAPSANEFTVTVNEADRSKKLEYSMDDTYWSNVPTLIDGAFELKGLAESTQYTIYLRVKASADGNYQASDAVSTVWTTPARYSVAYHANLGTGTVPASVTQNSGRSVTVARGSGLKRTGYTFAGWNTAANGTGTDYAPGSTISTGATLYAKWTANSYTVKFKANGGSGTMADQSFTYDATQVLTRNAFTRDGYHFAGWALSSGNTAIYMDGQIVKNLSDKGTVTLHAVWAENVYKIGADFFSKSSHSINAKLMRGDAQIGSAQSVPMSEAGATYTGHCDFTGVPKGVYNIVAEQDGQDGKVMTKLIIITDHNDTVEITMPPSEVNSVLEVSEDALPVVVGGLEDEAATKAEESKTVTITMTVEKQEEQQLPDNASEAEKATQEAIAEIKEKASGKAFEFMDIEVEKTVEEAGQAGVSEKLTETNKVMEIVIPFDLTGKMDIAVYRHHNGQTEKLAESTTKADGTFYIDAVNHLIHVFSRKFSTYAIGYTAPVVNPPSSGGDYAPTYAITVEDAENGDVKANRSYASSGTTVTITVTPEDGYVLKELSVVDSQNNKIEVTDKGDGTYTFKMPRRKVTVTASFVADGSFSACPKDNTCPIWPFTDAETTAWYHDGVHYCIENGLMAGYGDGIFKPNADTTRAMITVMLWRLNGSPVVNYLLDFEDVEEGKWYTEAIRWAKSEGIATGYGNGYFGTNDAVTREQMVTILWRYAQHKGYDVSVGENTNILSYDDAFDVAEYAIPAMQWACGSGMVQGMNDPDGEGMILAPASKGTRAQIATMIMRFCEEILK